MFVSVWQLSRKEVGPVFAPSPAPPSLYDACLPLRPQAVGVGLERALHTTAWFVSSRRLEYQPSAEIP